jgi:hypothetical protein
MVRISFNRRSHNRIIQAFSLALLFTSSSILLSDDLENFLDQRKHSAFENYENTCLKLQAWDACDETEFPAILKLLDEGKETRGPLKYPKQEATKGRNAIVELFFLINEEGNTEYLSTLKSVCGFGDIYLQTDWGSTDCDPFERAAKNSLAESSYAPVTISGSPARRMLARRFSFVIEGSNSREIRKQILDLDKRELRALNKLLRKATPQEIIEFAEPKTSSNPIYLYYLAQSFDQLGNTTEAIKSYKEFLSKTEDKYYFFANNTKSRLITLLYFQERHQEVSDIYDDEFRLYIKFMQGEDQHLFAYLLAASSRAILGEEIQALKMFMDLKNDFYKFAKIESTRQTLLENSNANIVAIIN